MKIEIPSRLEISFDANSLIHRFNTHLEAKPTHAIVYSYYRIPTLTFGPEVVVVFGATVILVVDAFVVLSHLEQLQGSLVDVVVSKRLQCQTYCGAIGLPVPGEDPCALLPV